MRWSIFLPRILNDGKNVSIWQMRKVGFRPQLPCPGLALKPCSSNPFIHSTTHHCVALLGSGNTRMGDQSWCLLHGAYGLVRKTGNKTFPRQVKKYLRQRKQGGDPEDSECQDREVWSSHRCGRGRRKPSLKVTLCWNLKRGEKKLGRHAVKTPVQVT